MLPLQAVELGPLIFGQPLGRRWSYGPEPVVQRLRGHVKALGDVFDRSVRGLDQPNGFALNSGVYRIRRGRPMWTPPAHCARFQVSTKRINHIELVSVYLRCSVAPCDPVTSVTSVIYFRRDCSW